MAMELLQQIRDAESQAEQIVAEARKEAADKIAQAEKTVGEHLTKYAVHEAYHAGQLGILRQELGK